MIIESKEIIERTKESLPIKCMIFKIADDQGLSFLSKILILTLRFSEDLQTDI